MRFFANVKQLTDTEWGLTTSGQAHSSVDVAKVQQAVFHLDHISKVYRMGDNEIHALRDVDLDLQPGEFVVLLGASGSGKSTLLNILGGLDRPTSGRVRYRDHELTSATVGELTQFRREHVGFVFQFYNLIPSLTAFENVALVTEIAASPMDPDEALGLVGMLVLSVLQHVNQTLGTITVVITHNAAIAAMADRVIRISSGRIVEVQRNVTKAMLGRMLWRDLWHLRGQLVAAALVVACGISVLLALRGTYQSLLLAQTDYYQTHRLADVFAHLRRAPDSLAEQMRQWPGVAQVQTRLVVEVTVDVPGLAEPAIAKLVSVPSTHRPLLNDLQLVRGRYLDAGASDQVLVSEVFATANGLQVADKLG
eukprot:gene2684-2626_t